MSPGEIRFDRPTMIDGLIGERNREIVTLFDRWARERVPFPPVLFVGPPGTGKTVVMDLIIRAYRCRSPDRTGEIPCGSCFCCLQDGEDFNGEGTGFVAWQVDCAHSGRKEVMEYLRAAAGEENPILAFDEIQHLHQRHAQQPLLTYLNRPRGLFMAATMVDEDHQEGDPIPDIHRALLDRLRIIRLHRPTVEELVAHFSRKAAIWGLEVEESAIRRIVIGEHGSFRRCQAEFALLASGGPVAPARDTHPGQARPAIDDWGLQHVEEND